MLNAVIRYEDGRETALKLLPGIYRIGSSPASHIQIERPEISSRHAQLHVSEREVKICDLGSSNGTSIDGRKIGQEPVPMPPGAVVKMGKVLLSLLPDPASLRDLPQSAGSKPKSAFDNLTPNSEAQSSSAQGRPSNPSKIPVLKVSGIPEESRPIVQEIKKRAHSELLKRLNLKRMALSGISDKDLSDKAEATIHDILSELSIPLPAGVSLEIIEKELVHEAIGLGPLEDLIGIGEITEVMVNGPNSVYVEKAGVLFKTDTAFADDNQVMAAIERIVSPLGRRIDESSPMVDARLKDGSRVNAIIPPLSLIGPTITIRKFSKTPFKVEDLVANGSFTMDVARFLDVCVKIRKNIVVSGGTGSGKTVLLNVLSSFLPSRERIVTIEDAAELQLGQEHVIRLEARPPNIEGKGEITIRDLVRNSLRMRPDRIVVGECRGGEALDMLQAMNTGHDGSLTTVHANSPRDALARLETLVLMAGFDLPLRAIREQIASAVTIIVQVGRNKDGSRKLLNVSEITKMEGEVITMQDIFIFKHDGWTPDGRIKGRHVGCGNIPTFIEDIQRSRLDLDISMFKDGRGDFR